MLLNLVRRIHKYKHALSSDRSRTHTRTDALITSNARKHNDIHSKTLSHTQTLKHTHKHSHSQTLIHIHTQTLIHIHTHTQTRTHIG